MENVESTPYASRLTFYDWVQRLGSVLLQPAWAIFSLSLVLTMLPVQWVDATWVPQGDEPHYLLAAHSLAVDGDLDVGNNYAQRDFASFYPGPLAGHVRTGVDGRSYLSHDIGLPILIAPAYALGGRGGVTIFLAAIAALVAVNVYLLAYQVAGNRKAATATWLALMAAPLLSVYAYLVYPEMIAALLVIWTARQLIPHPSRITHHASRFTLYAAPITVGVTLAICVLPWLSARFIPIAVFLALWAVWHWRHDRRRVAIAIGVPLASLIGYVVANAWMNGGGPGLADFNGGQVARGLQGFTLERVARGLAGWWLDQQRGVLVYSPVYVIALIGLPALWRRMRWAGLAVLTPLLVAYTSTVAWGGFWVGWELSARYLVVGLPLLAAPMALAFTHIRGFIFRGLAVLLLSISILNTLLVLASPGYYAYRESIVQFYDRWTGADVGRILPAMGGGGKVDPDPDAPSAATVVTDGDRSTWLAPAGSPGVVVQSAALEDLTIGSYALQFDARAGHARAADAPLLSADVFSGEGVLLLHRVLNRSDFAGESSYRSFALPFRSPFYNKWSYPVYVQISSSGLADVWVSALTVTADAGPTWGVTGAWIGLIGLAVFAFNRAVPKSLIRPDRK